MANYTTQPPRADWIWADAPPQPIPYPQLTVDQPVRTGLLDAEGRPIWRMPTPIGFIPLRERP